MKLKYYLRGLGIGILITVLILMIAGKKDTLSDEEIIARAEELGMVMKEKPGGIMDRFQDNDDGQFQENNDSTEDGSLPGEGSQPEAGDTDVTPLSDGTVPVQGDYGEDPLFADQGEVDSQTDMQNPTGVIAVHIGNGEYSDKISEKLQMAGLIDDAESFNHYLMETGIDSMISNGEYRFPYGASYEEIARILSEAPEAPNATENQQ